MGIAASTLALVPVIGVVANGRFDLAVMLPTDDNEAMSVAAAGFCLCTLVATFVLIIAAVFGRAVAPLVGLATAEYHWLYIVAPMVFFVGIEHILDRLHTRKRQYRTLATTQAIQHSAATAAKLSAGLAGMGVAGLYIGATVGHLVRTAGMLRGLWGWIRVSRDACRWDCIRAVATRYRRFPLVSSWSAMLNAASTNVPVLLFAALFSPVAAGYYALSHRILSLPASLVGQSVGKVYFERAARSKNQPEELRRLTLGLYRRGMLMGAIVLSIFAFHGEVIFPVIFGEEWREAGRYSQWIAVWLVFHIAYSPVSLLYTVLERQGEALAWHAGEFFFRVTVLVTAAIVYGDPYWGVIGYSISAALLYAARVIRVLVLSGVRVRQSVAEALAVLAPICLFQTAIVFVMRAAGLR